LQYIGRPSNCKQGPGSVVYDDALGSKTNDQCFKQKRRFNCLTLIAAALFSYTSFLLVEADPVKSGSKKGSNSKSSVKQIDYMLRSWGRLNFIVSEDAILIEDPLRQYTSCCKAPDWIVSIYSRKRKLIAQVPLSKYDGGLAGRWTKMTGGGFQKVHAWRVIGSEKVLGQLCTVRKFISDSQDPTDRAFWRHYAARDIKVKPQVLDFYYKSCGIPPMDGLCLKFVTGSSKATTLIEAQSIKTVPRTDKTFAVPVGFKKTSVEDVMFEERDF